MTTSTARLCIVATPIGTLSDFSPRAREILGQCDFIICEDTRRTKELMLALNLRHGPLVSLHEHNEREKSASLVDRLLASSQRLAALVSDAGTPAISDPGALFVDACHAAGVRIESVPGPSSLPAALAASGFLQPRILFSGFLPRSAADQKEEYKRWKAVAPCIAVCFESPVRVAGTLRTIAETFPPETRVCISREISKKFEEHLRGPIPMLLENISNADPLRGECVICIDIPEGVAPTGAPHKLSLDEAVGFATQQLTDDPSLRVKDLCKKIAEENNLNTKELYNAVVERRR